MKNTFRIPLFFLLFVSLLFSCQPKYSKIVKAERTYVEINDSTTTSDIRLDSMIAPYKKIIDAEMNEVLIISETPMIKEQPEGLLGNMVADIVLKKTLDKLPINVQEEPIFCVLNNGGLRTSLPEGDITRKKIYELMPFENEIVILTLSPENAQELMNYIARSGGVPVSGIKMGIQKNEAVNIFVNGNPFDKNKNYKIVTSDYLAEGGDKMFFFKNPINKEIIGLKIRDVLIEYMKEENKKGKTLSAKKDERIYLTGKTNNETEK
jgi:2',3'-cyclic-nucleotide 2'-phosphodiesterase (5'-nucleotidase family)